MNDEAAMSATKPNVFCCFGNKYKNELIAKNIPLYWFNECDKLWYHVYKLYSESC